MFQSIQCFSEIPELEVGILQAFPISVMHISSFHIFNAENDSLSFYSVE